MPVSNTQVVAAVVVAPAVITAATKIICSDAHATKLKFDVAEALRKLRAAVIKAIRDAANAIASEVKALFNAIVDAFKATIEAVRRLAKQYAHLFDGCANGKARDQRKAAQKAKEDQMNQRRQAVLAGQA